MHPVEGFSVFACFYIYGILFPIHPLAFAAAAFAVTAVDMTAHCNYRLPVYDWFFATARGHDIHHASREPRNISVMLSNGATILQRTAAAMATLHRITSGGLASTLAPARMC
jgi:sterol desaturase/sphingolipid hydroxylase (fatty acid hydroxylase superfamily)